jgi:hypothetical protein
MGAYHSAYDLPVRKARDIDRGKMLVRSVLTFPVPDLAGDVVDPAGLDFSPHQLDPCIDLEHSRTELKGFPVAWARESLSREGAPYAVEYIELPTGDAGEVDALPVGTSYFDPACRIGSQTFALVEQGLLPGVSLEFKSVPGFFKAIGYSELERRPSYHFGRASVLRWTLCRQGVNEGAMHVAKSVVPTDFDRVLRDKRVNVGGAWEPLHGRLLKALAGCAPVHNPTRTTVRVEKAMEDDDFENDDAGMDMGAPDDMGDDMETAVMDDMGDMTDDAPPANGVSAIYAHVQALEDAADQLEGDLNNSDNPKLITEVRATIADLRKHSAKLKKLGDKHDSKLQAVKGGDEMPEDTDAESAGEPDGDEDMERDDEGVLKAVRPCYRALLVKKARKVRAYSARDLDTAKKAKKQADPALLEQIARLEKRLSWLA